MIGVPAVNATKRVLYGAFLAASILALSFLHVSPPAGGGSEVAVIIAPPSIAELVQDSTALDFLARSGVTGILVKPSTLGGAHSVRDVTLATGAEILRIFKMESIVNIYMWEQIKDRPIRPDATYIFTNQLIIFETLLATMEERLGSNRVRPYSDKDLNFGGQVPGNYIIEALVSKSELISLVTGLDRTYRDTLRAAGLLPVLELSSAEDVAPGMGPVPAILVRNDLAARIAYEEIEAGQVFLEKGVVNPGWFRAQEAVFGLPETGALTANAIVIPQADVVSAIERLKTAGHGVGRRPANPDAGTPAADIGGRAARFAARLLLLFGGFTALLSALRVLAAGLTEATARLAAAAIASAAFLLLYPDFETDFAIACGLASILVAARERLSGEEILWKSASLLAILLLSSSTSLTFGLREPRVLALGLVGIALAGDGLRGAWNPFLAAAVALLAALPNASPPVWTLWFAGPAACAAAFTAQSRALKEALVVSLLPMTLALFFQEILPPGPRYAAALVYACCAAAAAFALRSSDEDLPGRENPQETFPGS